MSIFDDEKNKGKKELLEKWGYTVLDVLLKIRHYNLKYRSFSNKNIG